MSFHLSYFGSWEQQYTGLKSSNLSQSKYRLGGMLANSDTIGIVDIIKLLREEGMQYNRTGYAI